MRTLVTGGAGFIGSNLADGLLVCATEVTTSAEIVAFAGALSAVLGHSDIPAQVSA